MRSRLPSLDFEGAVGGLRARCNARLCYDQVEAILLTFSSRCITTTRLVSLK
jgi:hypothetical protein